MKSASRSDRGKTSATDNNSSPALRPPRVTTKVARPLHRAAVGRWCAVLRLQQEPRFWPCRPRKRRVRRGKLPTAASRPLLKEDWHSKGRVPE